MRTPEEQARYDEAVREDSAMRAQAKDEADRTFTAGSRWRKVVNGRAFVVELLPDGQLTEWAEPDPGTTWGGTWATGCTAEYAKPGGFSGPGYDVAFPALQIAVGPYEATILKSSSGDYRGHEGPVVNPYDESYIDVQLYPLV